MTDLELSLLSNLIVGWEAGIFPLFGTGKSSECGVGWDKNLVGLSDILDEFLEDMRWGLGSDWIILGVETECDEREETSVVVGCVHWSEDREKMGDWCPRDEAGDTIGEI